MNNNMMARPIMNTFLLVLNLIVLFFVTVFIFLNVIYLLHKSFQCAKRFIYNSDLLSYCRNLFHFFPKIFIIMRYMLFL